MNGLSEGDVRKLNRIQQTGVFEIPDVERKEEPDELWF